MERDSAQPPFVPKPAPEVVAIVFDQWLGRWIPPDAEQPLYQQKDHGKVDEKGELVPRYVTYVAKRTIGGSESRAN